MENEKTVSKLERKASKLMKRITDRDLNQGGTLTEITGAQGSGKTSVMLSLIKGTLNKYPREKVFFSNPYDIPLQSIRLGLQYQNILVKENSNVTFHDRDKKLKEIFPDITYFNTMDELYDSAQYGKINSVFFGDRLQWHEFMHFLLHVGEWVTVAFDEFGEVAPTNQSGKQHAQIGHFANVLKEIRKCMITVYQTTQSVSDIDYRIRNKTMLSIFLSGARANKLGRVTQRAIDRLRTSPKGNKAYIQSGGEFGLVQFTDIILPSGYHWEAKKPTKNVFEELKEVI